MCRQACRLADEGGFEGSLADFFEIHAVKW
jgi:hypothetical protein